MSGDLERRQRLIQTTPDKDELMHARIRADWIGREGRVPAVLVHHDGIVSSHDFGSQRELEDWMEKQGATREGNLWYFERPDW